jgi:hypothetical protein
LARRCAVRSPMPFAARQRVIVTNAHYSRWCYLLMIHLGKRLIRQGWRSYLPVVGRGHYPWSAAQA